jgi:hypothetical protein
MHLVCDKHGDCNFRFGCRHVLQASRVVASPTPVVDDLRSLGIVCRECLTSKVKKLLDQLCALSPEEYERYFDYHEQLRTEIGYCPVCLECLYENTGIDRRVT